MFLDNSLALSSTWSSAQAITTSADSTNVIDITGAGAGNTPAMINGFPALNTAIGEDWGAGDGEAIPYFYLSVTSAGSSTATITVLISAAPDNGSYSYGSYTTIYTSKAVAENTLAVGQVLIVPLPPTLYNFGTAEALPRFYKAHYTCSGAVTTNVLAGIVLNPQESLLLGKYNSNFIAV